MDAIILKSFYPEIFLSLVVLYQLVLNSRLINNISSKFPLINIEVLWQGLFILFCLLSLQNNQILEAYTTNFLFVADISTRIIKNILVLFSFICFVFVWRSFVLQNINFFEYFTLFFLSLLGILLLINTSDLIASYLVLELQALSFYVMACFKRTSAFSTEAGLKYFVLGSFISGLFLLGSFFIYASLGTLNFNSIALLLSIPMEDSGLKTIILIGGVLIVLSLLFKAAVAPFHFWAPDVYEGAPLASTITFSIVPKFAIFLFLLRWVSIFINEFTFLKIILILAGIFSVIWGAYFAINQKRLKRFIIYSSISQVGFIVVACSVCSVESYTAIFFYLSIYLISSIIIWGSLVFFYSSNKNILSFNNISYARPVFLSDFSSYFQLNYSWSLMLLGLFFSFAGIPPLSGFLSKLLIILSLINNSDIVVAVLLIVISIISTYYYLRIIKIVFFDKKNTGEVVKTFITISSPSTNFECTILSFCAFLLLILFFYPSFLLTILNLATFGCVLL